VKVLSFGMEPEIRDALRFIDVEHVFDQICGNDSYKWLGIRKADMKLQMLTCFRQAAGPHVEHLIFADDDRGNFPPAPPGPGGSRSTRPLPPAKFDRYQLQPLPDVSNDSDVSSATIYAGDCTLYTFPAGPEKGSAGLSVEDMRELLAFFRPPSKVPRGSKTEAVVGNKWKVSITNVDDSWKVSIVEVAGRYPL
jgi:hypothetical protein